MLPWIKKDVSRDKEIKRELGGARRLYMIKSINQGFGYYFFHLSFNDPTEAAYLTRLSHASAVLPGLNECSPCLLDWN